MDLDLKPQSLKSRFYSPIPRRASFIVPVIRKLRWNMLSGSTSHRRQNYYCESPHVHHPKTRLTPDSAVSYAASGKSDNKKKFASVWLPGQVEQPYSATIPLTNAIVTNPVFRNSHHELNQHDWPLLLLVSKCFFTALGPRAIEHFHVGQRCFEAYGIEKVSFEHKYQYIQYAQGWKSMYVFKPSYHQFLEIGG